MIFLCCTFFVVTVFMTVSLTALAVVPSLCYTFYQVAMFMFDVAVGAVIFYWNIMTFVLDIIKEVFHVVRPVFAHVMPVVYFYARDIYETVKVVMTEAWRNIRQGEEGLMIFWGAVVASFYFYWNQVREAFGNRNNEPNNLDQTVNANNEENHNERQNNPRPRNRLYPDLDDIDNYINNNELNQNINYNEQLYRDNENMAIRRRTDHNQGNLHPQRNGYNNNGRDSSYCVVCFERDRDTAVFPCGHTHTCMQCTLAVRRQNNLCPICQQNIREHRRVFV